MADANQTINVSENDITLAQRIISASSRHDVAALRILLKEGSANVKDPATGTSPLHAAISACKAQQNGDAAVSQEDSDAVKTVRYLLRNGAIWNDLNNENETPGCIAQKLGQKEIYDVMVDAGVRAELLFEKLRALNPDEEDEEMEDAPKPEDPDYDVSVDNHAYLKSELRFRPGILLDSSDNAVMMQWEDEIMKRHAETLLPKPGLRSMNIGHGLGLVDMAILARQPGEHHIVEAHPQVHKKLRDEGWYEKPNVTIHEGRWQDVLPKLVEQGVILDAIYYDTFAEDYTALKELFSEWVIQLMDQDGKFGWYNGLGADRQICYDVYTKVSMQFAAEMFYLPRDPGI